MNMKIIGLVLIAIGIVSGIITTTQFKGTEHIDKVECYDKFSHKIIGVECEQKETVYSNWRTFFSIMTFVTLLVGALFSISRDD